MFNRFGFSFSDSVSIYVKNKRNFLLSGNGFETSNKTVPNMFRN